MIDQQALAQVVTAEPLTHARRRFGVDGETAVTSLVASLRRIYEIVAPERLVVGLTVVHAIRLFDQALPAEFPVGAEVASDELRPNDADGATLIVLPNQRLRIVVGSVDLAAFCDSAVVYRFDPEVGESFLIGTEDPVKPISVSGFVSAYAIPTFHDLERALRRYARDRARHATRGDLRDVWRDPKRLMFLPAPEASMRRSLEDFLDASLRDGNKAEVWPEQNVDESRPVDLRVTFAHTNRVGLIEIKWLGKSAAVDSDSVVEYGASRAREGATQLSDYLDRYSKRAGDDVVVGYLVVFDARRRRVTPETTFISSADGLYFEDREVDFDPSFLERSDTVEPLRMFIRPECDPSAA